MAKSFSRKFYNSSAWIKTSRAFKNSKFGICEKCGNPGEEVHHIIALTPDNINDPNVTLNWDNLMLLCRSCHELIEESIIQNGVRPKFYVSTFGCQMNAHDSEKLIGILLKIGYDEVESEGEADFVIFNTCTVRENANQKLYNDVFVLGRLECMRAKRLKRTVSDGRR